MDQLGRTTMPNWHNQKRARLVKVERAAADASLGQGRQSSHIQTLESLHGNLTLQLAHCPAEAGVGRVGGGGRERVVN